MSAPTPRPGSAKRHNPGAPNLLNLPWEGLWKSWSMAEEWRPTARPTVSQMCHYGEHAVCGHLAASTFNVFAALVGRKSPELLCQCQCHASCPAAVGEKIQMAEYKRLCTCPGRPS